MSDRVEKKLEEVAVARYDYRHEAEFAAGFLDGAGIPYRLQLDDPALGMTVGVAATIWVRSMDLQRAREVLEIDERPVSLSGRTSRSARGSGHGRPPARGGSGVPGPRTGLEPRERAIAFLLAVGAWGIAAGVVSAGVSDALGYVTAGAGAILALVGVLGRAPGAVRGLLSALAGDAP